VFHSKKQKKKYFLHEFNSSVFVPILRSRLGLEYRKTALRLKPIPDDCKLVVTGRVSISSNRT
jgi:hypothetical protein